VSGTQDQKVMAIARSFSNSNFEQEDPSADEIVDEKTRFEMYYPPFEGAIEAGIKSVMCSPNKVNGLFACENDELLNGDLRDKLGFDGFVTSDWGAAKSVSLEQGLD
jgi:beta-glucosidase